MSRSDLGSRHERSTGAGGDRDRFQWSSEHPARTCERVPFVFGLRRERREVFFFFFFFFFFAAAAEKETLSSERSRKLF